MRTDYRAYEFNPGTRRMAIQQAGYGCEACQAVYRVKQIQTLQAHHLLPIWFAANFYPELSAGIVKGIGNAVILCPNCHDQLHDREESFHQIYHVFARQALISIEAFLSCQPKQTIFSLAKLSN